MVYSNQGFEKSLLNVLTILKNNWENVFSYEGSIKGDAIRNICFPTFGSYEYRIIWYPKKVSFFLNHVWKYQEVRRDPKSNQLTSLISVVTNSKFEVLFQELKDKKANNNAELLHEHREIRIFGRDLFNLIPPDGSIIHQLDYFLN